MNASNRIGSAKARAKGLLIVLLKDSVRNCLELASEPNIKIALVVYVTNEVSGNLAIALPLRDPWHIYADIS